jgi:TatD DNase family protein
MQFIDTHTHIYLPEFKDDIHQVIEEANQCGVDKFLLPNIDVASIEGVIALSEAYSNRCYPMLGLHPCSVKAGFEQELETLYHYLVQHPGFIAIGEIGLDLYWDKSTLEIQRQALIAQIHWAHQFDLHIVIHCREAFDELFEVLEGFPEHYFRGVLHCFTGTLEQANRAIALNLKLGIGGVSTYKNGGLDQVLPYVDLQHLILETDAPYLAPIPFRGKRNQPKYLKEIAERVALLSGNPIQKISEITTQNALVLFNIQA